ncbi:hypothetical protein V6N12_007409 [Hibiscus sabdariffa]|uniref:Uncharacterized protein n=1 Tax=Hibiscus sabdariffa TaxID=183260 RepID=A0ABR2F1P4_9ROSI
MQKIKLFPNLASSSGMQKIKPFRSCFTVRSAEDQTFQILLHRQRCRRSNCFQISLHRQGCRRSNILDLASPSGVQKIKPFRYCFIVRDAEDQIVSRSRFIVRDAEDQTF